ncbi:MAG: restriction endonuclease subunit M [Alteromonas sp. TMED35]|nr:MAG: restriction endonuclease subunit M [Alteromonas sp. TMED35]|tara:strand:- start:6056 stop:8098 length:2043 start_codon:yes stop_codon:yes gene_type:complete
MNEIKPEILSDNSETTVNSQQVETLKKHFPQCFDKDGNFIAEKLNEIVSNSGTSLSKESYGLNWLGKSYARLLANENPLTLLAEDKTHNQKPENKDSQNLLIEGDNLEVLKHLKGAYSESIKMIYIDPPYNTGSDGFVYQDDRKFTPEQLAKLAGIETEEAKRILEFTQSKANSHSAWLTFMYPRLYIARELLKDDGVIFISIDENELSQLKILCDEVFGEANFVECIAWNKRIPKNDKGIGNIHEYILLYTKNPAIRHEFLMLKEGLDEIQDLIKKLKRNSTSIAEAEQEIKKLYRKNGYDRGITLYNSLDKNYRLWGKINMSWPNQDTFGSDYIIPHPKTGNPVKIPDRGWRWKKSTFDEAAKRIDDKYTDIIELHDGSFMCGRIWFSADEKTQPSSIKYLDEVNYFLLRSIISTKSDGGVELENLFNGKSYFSRPKSTSLIKTLIASVQDSQNEIFLDFFAGSGTTAHAVMDLNKADNGNRKFICVQLPEVTEKSKAAYKAGYKTIFDITKARIEKAAEKIRAENPDYNGDLGFKIFETLPIFEGYLDNIETLQGEIQDMFDGATLSGEQLEHLLTTWKVYDGIPLTQPLIKTDLAGYTAFRHSKVLYLMHKGFKTESLKEFLSKLDTTTGSDKDFDVEKIVMFGYNFDSKNQLEINEAVRQYQNRKEKNVSVVVRY